VSFACFDGETGKSAREIGMTVGRILAAKGRDVATINPQCSVAEAAQILARKRIGAIVIVDGEGAVAGIFSERDIVRLLNAKGAAALQDEVANWMTRTVVTTSQSASVHSLMEQMTAGRFRHFPVVENGVLVGIVSIGDVVKQRLAEMEQEQQAMRDYIATA
jgi:CBS domain-containing protein